MGENFTSIPFLSATSGKKRTESNKTNEQPTLKRNNFFSNPYTKDNNYSIDDDSTKEALDKANEESDNESDSTDYIDEYVKYFNNKNETDFTKEEFLQNASGNILLDMYKNSNDNTTANILLSNATDEQKEEFKNALNVADLSWEDECILEPYLDSPKDSQYYTEDDFNTNESQRLQYDWD